MGLGLWHHATPALQLQVKSEREIPAKLADLNALSRFPEKPRGKRVHIVDLEAKCSRIEGDFGCVLPGFSQLCLGNVTRRALLLSKKCVKSSGKLSSSSLGRNGGRIVACAAGSSGESESSWRSEQVESIFGCSLVAGSSTGSLFWQPFWNNGGNVEGNILELRGGGGDSGGGHGNGGKGGDGSSGSEGSGGGSFDPSGHETHVRGEKKESGDEEQTNEEVPALRSPDFRAPVLASLSSAAGDALDGEAPFGDLLLGRIKRPGAAEERAEKVPSKTSDKGSQGGSSGPSSAKENERDSLAEEAAAHAALFMQQKDGDEGIAKRSETAALRRLQREAFAELMRVRERLDKLEFHTGLRKSKAQSSFGEGAAKTRLKGEVCAGGAFLLLDDQSSRYSRAALEQAGLHTGMDVRFTFETSYRERDVMITECSAGHSGSDGSILGGPISVTKLVYNAQVTDDLNVVVAPLGARGSDITETVNPLQGQALTQFARVGPAMYQHCVGSALGATLRGKTAHVSLSQYLSGWGTGSSLSDGSLNSGPLCLSTLAHIMFQPWENSVFSLSAVNRFWPSPPLPSFRGLHWSEMGPLVLSKTRHSHKSGSSSPQISSPRDFRTSFDTPSGMSNNASWGTPYDETERRIVPVPETHGNAMQSFALAGEIDVGANVSLAGWAQADRGYWLDESEKREIEWGVSLTKTVGKTVDWGLCVGSSKVDPWSAATNEGNTFLGTGDGSGEPCDMQLHMEAFMKLSMGRGFTLQPGLVYLLNKQSQTPALMLRSSWAL